MNDYVYNADDADIASWEANFTSRVGDGSGNSEENFHHAVLTAAAASAGGKFLDVGTGHGRIVGWLKPYAGHLTGIEPDLERCASCRRYHGGPKHISLLNCTAADLVRKRMTRHFDLITVSMVLQHISSATCDGMLRDVAALLAEDGVAIVSTTHFPEERFTVQSDANPMTVEDFDRYADRSTDHDQGLPVRFFSRVSFEAALDRAGFDTLVWQQFSYPKPDRAEPLEGMYGFSSGTLRDCGFSQFALVRHRDRPVHRHWWRRSKA